MLFHTTKSDEIIHEVIIWMSKLLRNILSLPKSAWYIRKKIRTKMADKNYYGFRMKILHNATQV